MPDLTRQVRILHLSDLHFGKAHRFNPPPTPQGDAPERSGYPTLLQKLEEDWRDPDPGCAVLVCITGDLATDVTYGEFQEAEKFLKDISATPIFGRKRGLGCVFLVPGNHDVFYGSDDVGERWQKWIELHNRVYGTNIRRENPLELVDVHDRVDDLGVIIACLNSSILVKKGSPEEKRGHVGHDQLENVKQKLEELPAQKLNSAIRIALIHHHPVLIPSLAEAGRGYDAIVNSGALLSILREYGFHLILHGHKHNPFIFTDDTQSALWRTFSQPILVACGGSVGSVELPASVQPRNCYNPKMAPCCGSDEDTCPNKRPSHLHMQRPRGASW